MHQNPWLGTVMVWGIILSGSLAFADDPDWETLPYTAHAAYQAVDVTGAGTFLPSPPIRMKGIILNNPEDMLNMSAGAPGVVGGQWQIIIQAVEPDDWGGTACWMGQTPPIAPLPLRYTNAEWEAEMSRVNYDPLTGHHFRQGDLVEVRARIPGLFHQGKTNINEAHSKDPANDFDVILIEAGVGRPGPAVIPSLADAVFFDSTRLTGGEYYQATWVRINDVQIVGGTWGANAMLSISDGTATLPMKLSVMGDFNDYDPPAGSFDVLGIFNQESPSNDFTTGYQVWVMRMADIVDHNTDPILLSAVSRKIHGQAGVFDLDLPLSGTPAIEPRVGGPTEIILTFSKAVQATDGQLDDTEIALSVGTLVDAAMDGAEMRLVLADIPTPSLLTITISGITDLIDNPLSGDTELTVKVHTGNVNGDSAVNILDLSAVKSQLFAPVTFSNFTCDVLVDGTINIQDLSKVKTHLFD
ncbi:MAG: hypothetical protein GXY44_02350 [Phycisphaerales bacterium]|nr:hypothetical protein [Phycisphaerales bacterium]